MQAATAAACRPARGCLLRAWLSHEVPDFLCPALNRVGSRYRNRSSWTISRPFSIAVAKRQDALAEHGTVDETIPIIQLDRRPLTRSLPVTCPGCGAVSQSNEEGVPGYYKPSRGTVGSYLSSRKNLREDQGGAGDDGARIPTCDRCHDLQHHSSGVPIAHPSVDSIQATIEESPFVKNHVYHVIDAADFPLSLVPKLQHALQLAPMRTKNRRAKSDPHYLKGKRMAQVSFIITRSDLLAPQKEQVDRMMPWLQQVLRDALGKSGGRGSVRLGNVRCVSSKRGWWTREVKQEIQGRGGAGWMVGKVNVGKSNLFEAVFPKGRSGPAGVSSSLITQSRHDAEGPPFGKIEDHPWPASSEPQSASEAAEPQTPTPAKDMECESQPDPDSLLPPSQPLVPYPQMPLVSSLPGTTAAPIRIPYNGGSSELIDLPGLARSTLETHVQPAHRQSLIMTSRPNPEQHTLAPGTSLLLGGGLIRLSCPASSAVPFLIAPFVNRALSAHLTSTVKAEAHETGEHVIGSIPSIVEPGTLTTLKPAGPFQLKWDVTRDRAAPMFRSLRSGAKLTPEKVPFIVYGADILIEGVGWIEVTAQVRRRRNLASTDDDEEDALTRLENASKNAAEREEAAFPEIEVFSPEGKYVALRRPMGAWMLNKPPTTRAMRKGRPRKSMKGAKKREKAVMRARVSDG